MPYYGASVAMRSLIAIGAKPQQLHNRPLGVKARTAYFPFQLAAEVSFTDFVNLATAGADQELSGMGVLGVRASDEGMQAFDAVNEALLQQKFERAIDRRRSGAAGVGTHTLE